MVPRAVQDTHKTYTRECGIIRSAEIWLEAGQGVFLEEDRMKDILKREIKADSNCIDAGSHALKRAYAHIAFEPLPEKRSG